jgi:hypothetical protein
MAQDRRINASELDFETLKANLINYMLEQPGAFQDYNFEGSAMNTVIDVLTYITHINSINANFALNETFLDTAQLRQSVVSHAKLLGYTPRATSPAIVYIDVELVSPTGLFVDGSNLPATINRGTIFSTVIGSISYNLIVSNTMTTSYGEHESGKYIFKNVKLEQGNIATRKYNYDPANFDSYIISSDFVNTDSLIVDIFESSTSTQSVTFVKSNNITNINEESNVYFLEESRDGFYEIKFGDGIIGTQLDAGNIIEMNYLVVGDGDINGASQFSLNDTIEGNADVIITTIQKASGGSAAESMESIRFSAPLAFTAQNRAVTPDDYKGIIQNSWGDIDTLTVWGGEDNIPPDYGKVYVSIKPKAREVLTDIEKEVIIGNILKPKNVVSISPILVDPDYTYIDLEVYYKFNPNVATSDEATLSQNIRTAITLYNDNKLKSFGGVFRNSNLLNVIDNSSIAVISTIMRIEMSKKFIPELGVEKLYTFNFNQPITHLSGKTQYVTSTEFTYRAESCRLKDYLDTEENKNIIQIIGATGTILNPNVGYVNYNTGEVVLEGFAPDSIVGVYDYLKIVTKPASSDISPMRNELLIINTATAIIVGEIDTMITGGTTAGIDYTTVSN